MAILVLLRFPCDLLELGFAFHLLRKCSLCEDSEGREVTSIEDLPVADEGAVP